MTRWIFKLTAFFGSLAIGLVGSLSFDYQQLVIDTRVQAVFTASKEDSTSHRMIPGIEVQENQPTEVFLDEATVGRPGKNKLMIRCYEEGAKAYAEIFFYFRSNTGEWKSRMSYVRIEKDPGAFCNPQIKDFNNDGFGDVTFGSKVAARGANELRTLLMYNRKNDMLDKVTNSGEFPNLEYNKELDCITAWAFHGATTTIFLRIEGNRLREFASIDTGSERVVTITRRSGERVVIRREPMREDEIYSRYSTYNPPN